MLESLAAGLDLLCPRACFRCDRPLSDDAGLCRPCRRAFPAPVLPATPGLDACVAGARYAGEVEAWVRAFKYPPATALPDPGPEEMLAALLEEAAAALGGPAPDLIAPIPLHPRRLRARGFNPPGLLARRLARQVGARFDPVALARTRDTPSQTGLDVGERRQNVAGAFRLVRRSGLGLVRRSAAPERVWLVDDVVTTGATLAAAARALRSAGVASVIGVAAAATERRRPVP